MAFIALNGSLGPHLTNNLKKNNCPSFLSVAMMNTMIKKKKLWEERVLLFCFGFFILQFTVHGEVRTGIQGQELKERLQRNPDYWLLCPHGLLILLCDAIQDHLPRCNNTHVNHQQRTCPINVPTGQSHGGNFSMSVSPSQLNLGDSSLVLT